MGLAQGAAVAAPAAPTARDGARVRCGRSPPPPPARGLEVGFSSGTPAAGASTGEIQLRLNKTDRSHFDEADDYSRGTNTAYADASKIAVYAGVSWSPRRRP
ncbi:hypothetical protein ACIQZB_39755 [Streptomyces sp. NPDC097727]|uniref:hypothetical protein n=1 Tax=Streptomyces sp. NPDC097727 TaxID=3366092 RepID=UPI0037F8DA30